MTATPLEDWHCFTLANGLRVAIEIGPASGLVAVQLRYRLGSRDEAADEWGYAHVVEHLLFRQTGTGHDYHAQIQASGGSANGSTWLDYSSYDTIAPVAALDQVLGLEAERMAELVTDADIISTECALIKSERSWTAVQHPCGLWDEDLQALAFPAGHGYHHSPFGTDEHLDAVTVERAVAFHQRYYAPNNAVLTIAGGVDLALTERLVVRHFGQLPPRHIAQRQPLAAAQGGKRLRRCINGDLPRVMLAYPAPPLGSAAHRHLDLLGDLLVTGRCCRLAQAQHAGTPFVEYGFELLPWQATSLVVLWASVLPNVDLHSAGATLSSIITQLAAPSSAELQRVQAWERLRSIQALESSAERASQAALALELGQDIAQLLSPEPICTVADLQAVATVFHPERCIEVEYRA